MCPVQCFSVWLLTVSRFEDMKIYLFNESCLDWFSSLFVFSPLWSPVLVSLVSYQHCCQDLKRFHLLVFPVWTLAPPGVEVVKCIYQSAAWLPPPSPSMQESNCSVCDPPFGATNWWQTSSRSLNNSCFDRSVKTDRTVHMPAGFRRLWHDCRLCLLLKQSWRRLPRCFIINMKMSTILASSCFCC